MPLRFVLRGLIPTAIVATFAFAPSRADAHQTSVSRSVVTLSKDKRRITYRLSYNTKDMAEALSVRAGDKDKAVAATPERVFAVVSDAIQIKANGECKPSLVSTENLDANDATAVIVWQLDCDGKIVNLVIDYQLFYDIDESHSGVLSPRDGDEKLSPYLFKKGGKPYHWRSTNWLSFVRFGIEHIVFGYDHVLFLFGLLLVVLLGRGTEGWQLRDFRQSARYTAIIVTSFTIAHSITLITAALGWFTLSSRFVESMIAASIAYVAVENIVYPHTRFRPVVTFLFGLIHGMGFASSMADLLPPEQVIVPLLLFNLGVELGQLLIVLAVLPLFALAARQLGADRFRRSFVPIGSAIVGSFGLLWLIERVFEVTILGF